MDFRLESSLPGHPKFLKFGRWLDSQDRKHQAAQWLIKIWAFAAEYRSSGILTGMDARDIELQIGWDGEPEELVAKLLELRFLDRDDLGTYSLHNWPERQPWVVGASKRKAAASVAAQARWSGPSAARMQAAQKRNGAAPSKSKRSHSYSDSFEAFWKLYPRKDAKQGACEEWKKLSSEEQASAIDDVPKRINANWAGRNLDKIPHASTYLHQKRFNDTLMELSTNCASSAAVRPIKNLGAEVRKTMGEPV